MSTIDDEARMAAGKRRGRGKNEKAVQITVETSRCPKCKSTRRGEYHRKRELPIAGLTATGEPYTHIVWRRTYCSDCGQARIDKTYDNRA